jgi:hypothetical protein
MPSDTYSTAPQAEVGAAPTVERSQALSTANPSNGQLDIQVYRRYSYSISASPGTISKIGPEYYVTITCKPSGLVYTHATTSLVSAATIITDFRAWLLTEIDLGTLSTKTCQDLVALYAYTDNSTNPSFRYQLTALLANAPATESSSEVDALIASVVATLGYIQV